MELLDQLSRHRVDSINDLAVKIGRDVKNVYNDLKALEGLGFVRLEREGRRRVPELLVQEITILLW
jgi:predicted transcriptional regulator